MAGKQKDFSKLDSVMNELGAGEEPQAIRKRYPSDGKLRDDQQRYTLIASKETIAQLKDYAHLVRRPIKDVAEEALKEYLDAHFEEAHKRFNESIRDRYGEQ